jgi:cystathionine gamma-lyase
MLWLETPTNPMLKLIDLQAVSKILTTKPGIISVADNTFATPVLQQPLNMGFDIVMHSVTKYINGHSDMIGGIVVTADETLQTRLSFIQNSVGAILSPFDSFLALRGAKTLAVRMQKHCSNAAQIAQHFQQHNQIKSVNYPGLASHPHHTLAKKQMHNFGGMVAMHLKSDLAGTVKFLEHCQLWTLAESLGGVESLIEHPAIMTHASIPADQRAQLGISDSLVRLSVGIEDPADLIADLEQALSQI